MSTTPLEQLLSSLLYSCQDVVPVPPYYFQPPSNLQPTCLPVDQYSSPALIQTILPPYLPPPTCSSPPELLPVPDCRTTPPPPYTSPTNTPSLHLPTPPYTSPTVCSSPLTYPSPPTDVGDEPVPSVVIHHKPSSYPRPTQHLKETYYWTPYSEYRTKLMDSSISKTELLDLLAYPVNAPVSGKTRRKSSSSDKPYNRPTTNSRTSFTSSQLESLEIRFSQCPTIEREERQEMSLQIGVSETAIRTWFQNRRAKQRRDQLKREQNFSGES